VVSETTSEYADVTEMFRHLKTLDEGSPAFRRQREAIVARTLPLADHIARRYKNRGEPIDDLVQAARVGLVNAVNRFDPDNGADFLSFAVPTMMGEVRRHFRDYGWAVKVPRRLKDLQGQLVKARAELSQQIGRAPTATEVAKHLGIAREAVMEATIASSNYSTLSTDIRATADDEYRSVGDTLGDIDPNIDKVVDLETVRPLIGALPDRERTVLTLRFFESMTQTQIADRMGYSQMHVSRLLAQALRRLRDQVREEVESGPAPTLKRGA
jgi:RNA polymerase sigma-B factor